VSSASLAYKGNFQNVSAGIGVFFEFFFTGGSITGFSIRTIRVKSSV
jgi:hypothetical protein